MEHDDRRPWLLLTVQNAAERAIVRAAAEITGLTPEVAQEVINGLAPAFDEESIILRRYAELAK